MQIKALPESVWTRIAAGEVVERPASAVKELIENALDAGARRIKVKLWDGGRLKIIVEDDGSGILFEDLPLAIMPHATSKISKISDLEAINTLGYRGEALASIAAVSKIEIMSRAKNNEAAQGGVIRACEGQIIEHVPTNCAIGTRIQIDDLFANFPARRKFLKSASGELRRSAACIREYAVCRPDVSFSLEHDGREVFSSDGSGDKRRLLSRIWGGEQEIKQVKSQSGHIELECWHQSRQNIRGNAARSDIMAFVNGRAVSDPVINGAVNAAARGFNSLNAARAVSGNWALFFKIDLSLVDVNIHPAKSEVRFRYPGEIFNAVHDAVNQLGGAVPIQAGAALSTINQARAALSTLNNDDFNGWNFDDPELRIAARISAQNAINARKYDNYKNNQRDSADFDFNPKNSQIEFKNRFLEKFSNNKSYNQEKIDKNNKLDKDNNKINNKINEIEKAKKPEIPSAEFMGQLASGYVVFNTPDGLVLMDPHAAHERIKYEQVRAEAKKSSGVQNLLVPVPLPPTLALEVEEFKDILEKAGLEFANIDGILHLKAVPSAAVSAETGKGDKHIEPETLLRASIAALKSGEEATPNDILWRAWANIACKAAVKLTTEISGDEAFALWHDLHMCEQPFFCPHGRPTLLKIANDELVKHFGRE